MPKAPSSSSTVSCRRSTGARSPHSERRLATWNGISFSELNAVSEEGLLSALFQQTNEGAEDPSQPVFDQRFYVASTSSLS